MNDPSKGNKKAFARLTSRFTPVREELDGTAMKRGPAAAPKFLIPRYKNDVGVTAEGLRLRGRSFDLFEREAIGRLDTPSLVSTAHGGFGRLLFTIPGWLFLPAGEDPVVPIMFGAITDLWTKLPSTTRLLILTHEATASNRSPPS